MPGSDREGPAEETQGSGNWGTAGSGFLVMSMVPSLGEVQFSGSVWVGWKKKIHKSLHPTSVRSETVVPSHGSIQNLSGISLGTWQTPSKGR